MSSPITFSGFNSIDFSSVVTALMNQASVPLQLLQARQSALQTKATQMSTLTSQVSSIQNAVSALSTSSGLTSFSASSSDSTAVGISAGAFASAGHYDVVVQELARAQVTASAGVPDSNTTVIATGGKITIGGVDVSISQSTTLQGLADTINSTTGMQVRASVVQAAANSYKLVLTSSASGTANAFTVTNANLLTGGTGVTFTDTDNDGISGDDDADNAVKATNASVLVNNVQITSSGNTLTTAIPGATLTLTKKDPLTTVGVDITADSSALRGKLTTFIAAYNNLVSFSSAQEKAAANGDQSSLGRDPALRSLRTTLRSALTSSYANTGTMRYLSELGVEFTRTGTLQMNNAVFNDAIAGGTDNAAKLLVGTGTPGVFNALQTTLASFTASSGVLPTGTQQITAQISTIADQIQRMQSRLDLQRASLQREFAAADMAMSKLSSQTGAIGNLSTAKS